MKHSRILIAGVAIAALLGRAAPRAVAAHPQEGRGGAEFLDDERPARHPTIVRDWWAAADRVFGSRADSRAQDWFHFRPTPRTQTGPYLEIGPARSLRDLRTNPDSGCWYADPFIGFEEGAWVVREDLDDLLRDSAAVALGVVSGLQGGFHEYGAAGLLIQVEVKRWLKKQPDYPHSDIVHFYYPRGKFRVGEVSICAQASGFPEPPALDAEILLFPGWLTDDPQNMPVQAWRIAFNTPQGLRAPVRLRELPEFRTLDFKQLQRWVRQAAESTGSEEGA